MKSLKVMVTLALLWVCTIAAQAPIEKLSSTENISLTSVEYVITNTGATTTVFSFIIIQDDVLMLSDGSRTLAAGQQTSITVNGQNMHLHSYELQLSEMGSN